MEARGGHGTIVDVYRANERLRELVTRTERGTLSRAQTKSWRGCQSCHGTKRTEGGGPSRLRKHDHKAGHMANLGTEEVKKVTVEGFTTNQKAVPGY